MTASPPTGRAIVFGKLPAHGDFIERGLTAGERAVLDAGIASGLTKSKAELGEQFETAHQAAPPWRFVQGPGLIGAAWTAGALAASIDSVGRRFVILAAATDLPRSAATPAVGEAMEGLIYDALAERWPAAVLAAAVGDIGLDFTAVESPASRWWTEGGPSYAPRAFHGAIEDLIPVMLRPADEGAGA